MDKINIKRSGAIIEQDLKGRYILYMTNIFIIPLFYMTFYDLGSEGFYTPLINQCFRLLK